MISPLKKLVAHANLYAYIAEKWHDFRENWMFAWVLFGWNPGLPTTFRWGFGFPYPYYDIQKKFKNMLNYINQLDQWLILQIGTFHTDILDSIMIFLTHMWDRGFLWFFLTIFLILCARYRSIGYVILIWLSTDILLGEGILKHIFNRPRPFQELSSIVLKIPEPITSSFPSGHTSISWCFAILFTYFFWRQSQWSVIVIWILAIGVMLSRLYLQVHYSTDIIAGICVGIISSVLAILLYARRSKFLISK